MPSMWQENPKEQWTATDVVNDLPRVLQDDVERRKDNEKLMETKFNSQICTTMKQSERLLALGLKKETADMSIGHTGLLYPYPHREEEDRVFIPAWSLHRLVSMIEEDFQSDGRFFCLPMFGFDKSDNLYDNIIDAYEWLIKNEYFPKEYLV